MLVVSAVSVKDQIMHLHEQQRYEENSSLRQRGVRAAAPHGSLGDARGQSPRSRKKCAWIVCVAAVVLGTWTGGCARLDKTIASALAKPYIVGGVMEMNTETPACSVFREDSGVTYILFQGNSMTNHDFDELFHEGRRARLEITQRANLPTKCRGGMIVEVQEVLEPIPPPLD